MFFSSMWHKINIVSLVLTKPVEFLSTGYLPLLLIQCWAIK
ncbi:hypothetical protein [Shouchella tritolerans]|nr:hypothetical protein [Shouchella tritolerans]